ncbi:hypothetical protein ACF0H5_006697 [Mactra antiquata]
MRSTDDDSLSEDDCNPENENLISNSKNNNATSNDNFENTQVMDGTNLKPVVDTESASETSFPKNWSNVRKLKEQRELLHQKLFANSLKLNVPHKNDCHGNDKRDELVTKDVSDGDFFDSEMSDTESCESENLVIDETCTSGSKDSLNKNEIKGHRNDKKNRKRTKYTNNGCHGDAKECEGNRKKRFKRCELEMDCLSEDDNANSHDCSDLCLLTPAKINDALHVAIASVNNDVGKKQTKAKMKNVLSSLKIKSEFNDTTALSEPASYTISKPCVNLPEVSGDSFENLVNERYESVDSDYNDEITANPNHCSYNENWRYFGVPYNSFTSNQLNHTNDESENGQHRSCDKQKAKRSRKLSGTPSEFGDCGRHTIDSESNIDYTNIAFQKLMAERRVAVNSESENDLHEKKTQDSTYKDLKMIRSASETGTTLVDFQEVHKHHNTNDRKRKNIKDLYHRAKEVREAEKSKLALELELLKLKNHAMNLTHGLRGQKSNCLRPAKTSNSSLQKTVTSVKDAGKKSETSAKNSEIITTKSASENVIPAVITKRLSTEGNYLKHLNSTTLACTAVANNNICKSTKVNNLPTSCVNTESDQGLCANILMSGKSKLNGSSTRSIISSQSLLKKHLSHKDKILNPTSVITDANCYQLPVSTVASVSALPISTNYMVSEYRVQNINSKKVQPTAANSLSSCTTNTSSVSSIQGLTPIVFDKNNVDDLLNPAMKQCGTNKQLPAYNCNGSPFFAMNNRLYLIRSSTPSTGPATTGGISMVTSCPVSAPVLSTVVPVFDPNLGTTYVNILPRVVSKDSSPNLSHGVRLVTSIQSFVQKIPISRYSLASNNKAVNYVLVPTCGQSATHKQKIQGVQVVSSGSKSNFVVNANGTNSSVSQRFPYPVQLHYVGIHDEQGRNVQSVLQKASHHVNVTNSTTTVQSKPTCRTSVVTTSSSHFTKSKSDHDSVVKTSEVNSLNIQNTEKQRNLVSETSTSHTIDLNSVVTATEKSGFHNLVANSKEPISSEATTVESGKLIENGQVVRKRKRKHSEAVGDDLLNDQTQFGKCDISKHKRKRKDKHVKKANEVEKVCNDKLPETDKVEETKLLNEWMAEQEEIKKRKSVSEDEDQHDERVETPVPFVNYPARIVSKECSEDGTKIASIVGTPKHGNSSTDTSLNEEKMIKLLTFADEYEMEQKQKGASAVKRKGKFKRRMKNSRNYSQTCMSDDNLQESYTKSTNVIDTESEGDNSVKKRLSDHFQSDIEKEASSSKRNVTHTDPESVQHDNDRNIFNTFDIIEPKETENTEIKEPSIDDCYDSSDAENYEKFILNKARNSMKRKSQLIESYYTAERLQEQTFNNMVPSSSKDNDLNDSEPYIVDRNACISSQSAEPEYSSEMNAHNVCVDIPGNCGMLTLLTKTSPQELSLAPNFVSSVTAPPLASSYLLNATNRKNLYGLNFNSGRRQVTHTVNSGCVHHHGMFRHTSEAVIGPKSFPCYREMFIKTKLIILKGEMCDKWMKIKNQTGFGEMTDPQFLQYLMRLEEERQKRMLLDSPDILEEPLYFEDSLLSRDLFLQY